ncbi:MAG: EAL domain-containing protein [Kamptonema sp. SIO4C4]|nr:EAL domain-containing protein [Kamptonema sp. SIO4C4]
MIFNRVCTQPSESNSELLEDDDLIQVLSQELRTPLTVVQGAVSLLQSLFFDEDASQQNNLFKLALENTHRLEQVIQTLETRKTTLLPMLSCIDLARLRLQHDLQEAIGTEQLFLLYQPIVSLPSQKIMGFEALIRWQHPQQGLISPQQFIPLAEEGEFIHELGLWVLEKACYQLKQWQTEFPQASPLTMQVNLSPSQLFQMNVVTQVQEIIEKTKIDPRSLSLELTEDALLEEKIEAAIATLTDLAALGISLHLDDFGTGYSSLSRLQYLPIHCLKIDQSFIKAQNWTIIQIILQLAAQLGLEVIAEGVETPIQLAKLQQLGCCFSQGYLFGKPLAVTGAATLLLQKQCDKRLKKQCQKSCELALLHQATCYSD